VIAVWRENNLTCGPTFVTIDVQSCLHLHRSKALDSRHGGSALPRLGVTEE